MKYLRIVEAIFWVSVIGVCNVPVAHSVEDPGKTNSSSLTDSPGDPGKSGNSNSIDSPDHKTNGNPIDPSKSGSSNPDLIDHSKKGGSNNMGSPGSETNKNSVAPSPLATRNDPAPSPLATRNDPGINCVANNLKTFLLNIEEHSINIREDANNIMEFKEHIKHGYITIRDMLNLAKITQKWIFVVLTLRLTVMSPASMICGEIIKLSHALNSDENCSVDQNEGSDPNKIIKAFAVVYNTANQSCDSTKFGKVHSCMQSSKKFIDTACWFCQIILQAMSLIR